MAGFWKFLLGVFAFCVPLVLTSMLLMVDYLDGELGNLAGVGAGAGGAAAGARGRGGLQHQAGGVGGARGGGGGGGGNNDRRWEF